MFVKKAQSLVEYILLMAAVIMVILMFLHPNGIFRQTVQELTIDGTVNMLDTMAGGLDYSANED